MAAGHVYIVIQEVIHLEAPKSISFVLIVIQSFLSPLNLVIVNGAYRYLRLLVCVKRVLVVEANNPL